MNHFKKKSNLRIKLLDLLIIILWLMDERTVGIMSLAGKATSKIKLMINW